jgi:hypothetical protein
MRSCQLSLCKHGPGGFGWFRWPLKILYNVHSRPNKLQKTRVLLKLWKRRDRQACLFPWIPSRWKPWSILTWHFGYVLGMPGPLSAPSPITDRSSRCSPLFGRKEKENKRPLSVDLHHWESLVKVCLSLIQFWPVIAFKWFAENKTCSYVKTIPTQVYLNSSMLGL